jgi:phage shock protein PspC (stress-responsive transcriptional regulator)
MEDKKTLYRINEGKVFTGVCNGLAEHFNMEVQTVRILYVVASLLWALPIIIYIVLSFTLPVKELATPKKDMLQDEYAYDPNDYKL